MRTVEENKKLCEEMPFLIPMDGCTGEILEDYDYTYIIGDYELPLGWQKLFLQMCKDIRAPLIKANYLNEFCFSQIKEKFGTMHCYDDGAPKEVHDIIDKYEYISQFVCMECGKPAGYQTHNWVAEYCEDCIKRKIKPEYLEEYLIKYKQDEFNSTMCIYGYANGINYKKYLSCADEWSRLYSV